MLDIISKHATGLENYITCYQNLTYITSGEAKKKLNDFFSIEPVPLLREYEQKIKGYDALRKEICMFRCKVSLNFFINF